MLKKRLIFTLLWDNGSFCLSRNFRLQRVGDFDWPERRYNFQTVAASIDELALIDVTRGERQSSEFRAVVDRFASHFHMPLSVGGGLRDPRSVREAFESGADKVVLNSMLWDAPDAVQEVESTYGRQCLVASVDFKRVGSERRVFATDGRVQREALREYVSRFVAPLAGEILLNDIDADGTGHGIDLAVIDDLPHGLEQQVVVMGGVGTGAHVAQALSLPGVDAVSTANLLNFIGTGLHEARMDCERAGVPVAQRMPSEWVHSIDGSERP